MARPTAKDAFLVAGAGFGVLVLVGGVIGGLAGLVYALSGEDFDPERLEIWAIYGLPVQHGALLLLGLWFASRWGGWREVLAWRAPRRWWAVLLVIPVGLLSDVVVEVLYRVAPWLDLGGLDLLNAALLDAGPLATASVLLGAVVMAPIAEEVLFRGLVYRGLKNSWGLGWAIAVSTILFAVFHLDPMHALGVMVIGVYLGWLRHYTGSLIACVLAHLINNLVWVVHGLLTGAS